jgi:small conductance mechanosensitive channel
MFSHYLGIGASKLWSFLSGPAFTALIWYVVDRGLRKLYDKSTVIEHIVARFTSKKSLQKLIQQRVRTFRSISLQTVRVVVAAFFILKMLSYFIDPRPLLAGIGVVGLGLSLGAQNIMRDFLNGLFIIIEDQYNVGDFVTIGSFSGTVESFTMRVTRLRAFDGRLITIPNGNISEVVNSTKDFAVANVEVGVSYGADIGNVLEVMEECAAEVMKMFPGVVVEEPKVQGILAFRDNDVLLRVFARTLPGEQWSIERAMRMIIKERFDREKIDIPLPQVVVHSDADPTSAGPKTPR